MKTVTLASLGTIALIGIAFMSFLSVPEVGIRKGRPIKQPVVSTQIKSLQLSHAIDGLACGSSNGELLVVAKSRENKRRLLLRCDLDNSKCAELFSTSEVLFGPAVSPNGAVAFCALWRTGAGERSEIASFRTNDGGQLRKMKAPSTDGLGVELTSDATAIALSPDGNLLACGSKLVDSQFVAGGHIGGEVCIWNTASGSVVWRNRTTHSDIVRAIKFSPDSKLLFSAGDDAHTRIWDATSGDLKGTLVGTLWDGVVSMTISPDGRYLATGGQGREEGGRVRVWDLKTRQTIHLSQPFLRETNVHVAFCSDGALVAAGVAKSHDSTSSEEPRFDLYRWAVDDFRVKHLVGHGISWIRALLAAPESRSVYVGTWDGQILQFDFIDEQRRQ
ncbi:MAG: hypothetical protein Aurels2KO_56150 [Aureliella sp.]